MPPSVVKPMSSAPTRLAAVWRTLNPFQPSRTTPCAATSAWTAAQAPASRRPADDHRRAHRLRQRVGDRRRQVAEQRRVVAELRHRVGQVDRRPDVEHRRAALANRLADARVDQRRFLARVGPDQQRSTSALLDAGQPGVEQIAASARPPRPAPPSTRHSWRADPSVPSRSFSATIASTSARSPRDRRDLLAAQPRQAPP